MMLCTQSPDLCYKWTTDSSVHMTLVVSRPIKTGASRPLYGARRLGRPCASIHPREGFYVN